MLTVACDCTRRIMLTGEYERNVANCIGCDAVYPVKKWSEGTIQPIGCKECRCGSTKFRVIEYSPTAFQTEDSVETLDR